MEDRGDLQIKFSKAKTFLFLKASSASFPPLSPWPFSPDCDSTELRWWEVTTPPLVATGHHPGYIARLSRSAF